MNDEDDWGESALIRALRAPGTPHELIGEDDAIAAFRAASNQRTAPRRSRFLRRLGLGATTTVIAIGLPGGVAAAAFQNALPDALQHFAHRALAPLGVPDTVAPTPDVNVRASDPPENSRLSRPPATAPPSSADPAPEGSGISAPTPTSAASQAPQGPDAVSGAEAGPTPSTAPTRTASASPTRSPDRGGQASTIKVSASALRVRAGSSVTVTVSVTSSTGEPWTGPLAMIAQSADGRRQTVARTQSDDTGAASITTPAIVRTTRFWVKAGGSFSRGIRVVLVPRLEAHYSNGQLAISADDVCAGDRVVVSREHHGQIAAVTLNPSGQAVMPVEPEAHAVRYSVRLPATAGHAGTRAFIVVPRQAASPTPRSSSLP